ncbi:MAG: SIS domain-containing protein [Planctomycetaceae bacterium]|nr:SIS domain-containing protein [Planctomycetaceae bacterium]
MSQLEAEIREVPEVVARLAHRNRPALEALAERWTKARPGALFTLARGSSDAAATFALYRWAELGLAAGSLAPSLGGGAAPAPELRGAWLLAISQSGASEDLVRAARRLAPGAGMSLALCNRPESDLARAMELCLDQCAGIEHSIAATKSFQASLALVEAIATALVSGADAVPDRLAALAQGLVRADAPLEGAELLQGAASALVLSRGACLAAAQEVALKLKETAGLHAEAISAAEVMHGPRALAARGIAVLALVPTGEAGASTRAAADQLHTLGAKVARMDLAHCSGSGHGPAHFDAAVLVQSFYRVLLPLARARGQDPDAPPNLQKVTSTR